MTVMLPGLTRFSSWEIENFPPPQNLVLGRNGTDDTEAVQMCTATLTKTLKDSTAKNGGGSHDPQGEKANPQRAEYITWGTPKWMVKIMGNPIQMDDLGVPLFSETSIQLGGGNSNIFYCHPCLGKIPHFDEHIFQRGWFNHQLENVLGCVFFLTQDVESILYYILS